MTGKQNLIKTKIINNLKIWNLKLNKYLEIPTVYTNWNWPFSRGDATTRGDIAGFPYLKDVPLEYIKNGRIGLLIGMNVPELMYPLKTIPQNTDMLPHGPYATLHKLGWALQGPIFKTTDNIESTSCYITESIEIESLNRKIKLLFSRDFMECGDPELGLSVENRMWHQWVEQSLKKLPDGHYKIGLPFRQNTPSLPSNRYQVLARFQSLRNEY